jgi:hypothetical protein
MLICPHVTLDGRVPDWTATALSPVPVAVFPLKLPKKSAEMLMAVLLVLVVNVLFVMLAVPPVALIPTAFWLKVLPLMVGPAPATWTAPNGVTVFVRLLLVRLTAEFPLAM